MAVTHLIYLIQLKRIKPICFLPQLQFLVYRFEKLEVWPINFHLHDNSDLKVIIYTSLNFHLFFTILGGLEFLDIHNTDNFSFDMLPGNNAVMHFFFVSLGNIDRPRKQSISLYMITQILKSFSIPP